MCPRWYTRNETCHTYPFFFPHTYPIPFLSTSSLELDPEDSAEAALGLGGLLAATFALGQLIGPILAAFMVQRLGFALATTAMAFGMAAVLIGLLVGSRLGGRLGGRLFARSARRKRRDRRTSATAFLQVSTEAALAEGVTEGGTEGGKPCPSEAQMTGASEASCASGLSDHDEKTNESLVSDGSQTESAEILQSLQNPSPRSEVASLFSAHIFHQGNGQYSYS